MTETVLIEGLTAATFSVDGERRTMTGVVMPWGAIGYKEGRRYRFARGGLRYVAAKYLRLNDEHVARAVLGRATADVDTDEGLVLKFAVYDGPAGDRALEMASRGEKTGLSVEVDFAAEDTEPDPENPGVILVNDSHLIGVGFTRKPAFTTARLISVTASQNGGIQMECAHCGQVHAAGVTACAAPATLPEPPAVVETPPAAPERVTFSAEQFEALMGRLEAVPAARPTVDPTGRVPGAAVTSEPLPYRFSRVDTGKYQFSSSTEHDFSTDLIDMLTMQRSGRDYSAPLARLNGFIRESFADVEIADLPGSLVSERRPDMWVPQRDYATPLWDLTGRGAPPEGPRKFDIPKFTSSSGLVSVATEKTEPAGGSFVDEMQTVIPGQLWGKVEITRQVWRQGGNPAFSGILWSQMLREFYEDREAAIATFLATLTAATDITITATPAAPDNDDYQASIESYEQAITDLQFVRGGNRFEAFAVHQALYRVGARVKDDMGRPLYPMINPMNANGTTARRYKTMDIGGTTWVPAYALGTPAAAPTNSWLFDPAVVLAWAGAPERLFWDFGATVQTSNIPQLSFVTVGLYADYATANTDITGVRQVIFDPNSEA